MATDVIDVEKVAQARAFKTFSPVEPSSRQIFRWAPSLFLSSAI